MIVCRFLLDLRQVNEDSQDTCLSTAQFAEPPLHLRIRGDIVGNIGEDLSYESDDLDASYAEREARSIPLLVKRSSASIA